MPSISVVYDGAISNTSSTIITDSGQFIESVTPEEYALITNPFKCKTIEQKNNILFAGNILQQEFDVDYDARIRRYNYISEAESGIPTIYEVQFYVSTDTALPEAEFPETGFDCTVITNVTISSTPYSLVSTFNITSLSEVPVKLVAGYDMVTTGIQCDLVNINLGIS